MLTNYTTKSSSNLKLLSFKIFYDMEWIIYLSLSTGKKSIVLLDKRSDSDFICL